MPRPLRVESLDAATLHPARARFCTCRLQACRAAANACPVFAQGSRDQQFRLRGTGANSPARLSGSMASTSVLGLLQPARRARPLPGGFRNQ